MIYYQITDPEYFSFSEDKFILQLFKSYRAFKPGFICYRDKKKKNRIQISKKIVAIGKRYRLKTIINQDLKLAVKAGFYGIHLTSTQFKEIKKAKRAGLFTIVSTHSESEVKLALKLRADLVTYSPIFKTPNKGKPKGIQNLEKISKRYRGRVLALGGITTKEQIEAVKKTEAAGFASIKYFV